MKRNTFLLFFVILAFLTSCQLKESSKTEHSITLSTDFNSNPDYYFAIAKTEEKEYVETLRGLYSLLANNTPYNVDTEEVKKLIELYDDKYCQYIMDSITTRKCSTMDEDSFTVKFEKNANSYYSFILFQDIDKDEKISYGDLLYFYGLNNGKIFYSDEELEENYNLNMSQFGTIDPIIDQIYEAYSNKISRIGIIKSGDYQFYNNQWGKEHASGSDLFQKIILNDKSVPINCSWSWNWGGPYEEYWHVKAYPEVNYGYSPWGHLITLDDKLPNKIQDINKFTANYKAKFTNLTGRYNLAFEVWMTENNPPQPSNITTEIMIWVDCERTWEFWGDNVTEVLIDGKEYFLNIAHADFHDKYEWKYIALRMKESQLEGEIDFLPILNYLLDKGHISKDDYVCNLELGTEIGSGTGTLELSNYYVSIE